MWTKIIVTGLVSLLMISCTGRTGQLQRTVDRISGDIQNEFQTVKQNIATMSSNIQDVYQHADRYDLSIDKLDVENGGLFTTFRDNTFYYKITNVGASYYLSPGKPVTTAMKKEVKKAGFTEKFMMNAFERQSDIINMVFLGFDKPYNLALVYPWLDVVSAFPPAIQLNYFEWYKRGYNSPGEALWAPYPFTDLYNGWVIDIAMPVFKDRKPIGATVISMGIRKIVSKYLSTQKEHLMLLGPEMSLLGISPSVKQILPVKILEDIDYTRQMKENSFVQNEYKLNHKDQPAILQQLTVAIKSGKRQFEAQQGENTLHFTISTIPETGWYVVGILEK